VKSGDPSSRWEPHVVPVELRPLPVAYRHGQDAARKQEAPSVNGELPEYLKHGNTGFLQSDIGNLNMTEKVLYHKIHPAKLPTDCITTIPTLYLLHIHELILGVVVTLIP
jgi:hypothetical protein